MNLPPLSPYTIHRKEDPSWTRVLPKNFSASLPPAPTPTPTSKKSLPELDHSDIYYATFCLPVEDRLLQEINPRSRSRDEEYTFQPDDRFTLTDKGRDMFEQAEEERRRSLLLYISTGASIIAALTGLLALLR